MSPKNSISVNLPLDLELYIVAYVLSLDSEGTLID